MDGAPIPWGCIQIFGDKILQVGPLDSLERAPDEGLQDFPDAILMPGLINAHCHLELGMVRGQLPRGESFPIWVSRLRKALEGLEPENYRQAARLGALECLKNGTTTIIDVGNTGESIFELAKLPIRSFPYLELVGLNPEMAPEKIRQAQARLNSLPKSTHLLNPGLTCHAPYSCSVELMREAAKGRDSGPISNPNHNQGPYTLHVAESVEESRMFLEGRGTLLEFCRRIFPDYLWKNSESPIKYLQRHGLIPKGALFAHCNHLTEEDIGILSEKEISVVHCPRSKAFFNHEGFSLDSLRVAGINLCLGTDSLASNEGLSLFDEMAELHRNYPSLPCYDILAMATLNGARALKQESNLGCLKPGAKADFIALSLHHHPEYDIYEEIVSEAHAVLMVCIAGEEIIS